MAVGEGTGLEFFFFSVFKRGIVGFLSVYTKAGEVRR